ncbi:single-stranded DNA-binding protein [Bifidobacterium felsineum]|uniref:Single-stranded DNA-binding protein n=1 Tax=Bifidobacterium felsineum TaxID=2045440 RepID=A0A2M9HME9_9BIFI|nr:single-stranded DNA-binding protein [Bifidobacterium felsineum]MBT1164249.1 single-stranded DNA-binding protein [Bifidobacterium felsineum]PJM77986.1 single-stranded DNA-binding protein [Bifidobacterium felsineum]
MAIQQATVTITGFVATDPILKETPNFSVLNFRVGSNRSRLDMSTGEWKDLGSCWIPVKAFRALAVNTHKSIRKGDKLIVLGTLTTEQWKTEQGETRSRMVLEASNIGHDFNYATTTLTKVPRANQENKTENTAAQGVTLQTRSEEEPNQRQDAPVDDDFENSPGI